MTLPSRVTGTWWRLDKCLPPPTFPARAVYVFIGSFVETSTKLVSLIKCTRASAFVATGLGKAGRSIGEENARTPTSTFSRRACGQREQQVPRLGSAAAQKRTKGPKVKDQKPASRNRSRIDFLSSCRGISQILPPGSFQERRRNEKSHTCSFPNIVHRPCQHSPGVPHGFGDRQRTLGLD